MVWMICEVLAIFDNERQVTEEITTPDTASFQSRPVCSPFVKISDASLTMSQFPAT